MALLDALRHRDFRLFYGGQAVSQLGDTVFHVALAWQAFQLTGDAKTLGLAMSAYFAAQVPLLVFGGVVVDRFPRRRLVVASDVLQGILVATLAALVFADLLAPALMYAFAALFGAAAALAMPAIGAYVPETVPPEDLASANSLFSIGRTFAFIGGPILAGILIQRVGTGAAFAFDAATFAVSSVLLLLARPGRRPVPRARSVVGDVKEALSYVRGQPWLWMTIVLFSVVNLAEAGPRNVAMTPYVSRVFGLDAGALGLVLSVQAAGSLLAFVLVGSRPPSRARRGLVAYLGTAGSGTALLLLAVAPTFPLVLVVSFFGFFCIGVFGVVWETTMGDSVDPEVRGRVISLDMLGSFALLPVAMAGSGWLAEALGARWTFGLGGAVALLMAIVGLAVPAAHRFERARRETGEEEAAEPAASA